MVMIRHPSLWNFLRILKDQLAVNSVKRQAMYGGDPATPRKAKWRRLDARIRKLKLQYNSGRRGIRSYWRAISHCIIEFAS